MVLVSFYVSTAKEQSKFSSLVTKYKLPSFINLFLNLLFYVVSVQCRVAPKIYRMDKLKAIECVALSCWCCFLKTSVLLESLINRSSAKNSNWSDFCFSKKISLHPFSYRKTVFPPSPSCGIIGWFESSTRVKYFSGQASNMTLWGTTASPADPEKSTWGSRSRRRERPQTTSTRRSTLDQWSRQHLWFCIKVFSANVVAIPNAAMVPKPASRAFWHRSL